jgi:hypothetical protein
MLIDPEVRERLIKRGLPPNADEKTTRAWMLEKLPGLVKLFDFMAMVYCESDRGCVICATAFIDDALEDAIRKYLKELSGASEKLLDALLTKQPLPPIGAFAVRAKVARALGLIDDKIATALDAMRPLRNDAAHLSEPFSFDNPKYDIDSLLTPLSKKEQIYFGAHRLINKETPKKAMPTRALFQTVSSSIYFRMVIISENPSLCPAIHKAGGNFSANFGPYDEYYDKLMSQPQSEFGSSPDSRSTA